MIRQTALKISIGGIIESDAGNSAKVNVIAVVVSKQKLSGYGSMVIDDGSSRIELREFETNYFERLNIGDAVMVIGWVRQFNSKYVVPEIVKKVDINWLRFRQLELKSRDGSNAGSSEEENGFDRILGFIKNNDHGNGVDIGLVSAKTGVKDSKEILAALIKDGLVFELGEGKVKVLD